MASSTAYLRARWAGLWILMPLLQAAYLVLFARPAAAAGWEVQAGHWLCTALSSFFLFNEKRSWSLHQIFWLFNMVFFGLVPSLHFAAGVMPWRSGDVPAGVMLKANGVVLSSLVLFAGVYFLAQRGSIRNEDTAPPPPVPSRYLIRYKRWTPFLLLACAVALISVQGWKGLWLRGHAEEAMQRFSGTFLLLFDKLVRGVMLYLAVAGIRLWRGGRLRGGYVLAVVLAVLLLNFPLSLPRYLTATVLLALLLSAGWLNRRYLLAGLLLVAIFVLSPLVNISRYSREAPLHVRMRSAADAYRVSFLVADFDPYASLCRTMQYTAAQGTTGGRQLAGVALFYVPRKAWPDKPVGSGRLVYEYLDFSFANVACTFLAEGWINFGLAGSLLFAVLLAVLTARYDRYADSRRPFRFGYLALFYPVAVGMLFFVLRGDLLSSTAYTVGLFVSGWGLHRLLLLPRRRRGPLLLPPRGSDVL